MQTPARWISLLLAVPSLVLLAGCETSSGGVSRADQNVPINISYGQVTNAEQVDLKSDVGKSATLGAIFGGVIGLATGQNVAGAAAGAGAGALLGGVTQKVSEGSSKAMSYTVRKKSGGEIKVVTDDSHLVAGDCVAVETGRTTNLRRVSNEMCGATLNHPVEQQLRSMHQEDAQACDAAKQDLLAADSDQDVDAAIKKVRVLCKH